MRTMVLKIVGDASSLERSFKQANKSAKTFTRDMEKAGRGALAGSGLFKGFGRSIAFASGGYLAFSGATEFLTKSIDAAREAAVAQRSLAAQMKVSRESFKQNQAVIEEAANSYAKFGFQNDEVIQSLTVLDRATGNISKSISLQGGVADLARAKNIGLASAAAIVGKALSGQETALRRAVVGLPKAAHGADLVRLAFARVAGQAAANTTASERFAATLHNTEEIIGTALLPTLNKYLGSLGRWLQRMNQSGKLQQDVTTITHDLSAAFSAIAGVIRGLDNVTGSFANTIKDLAAAWLLVKTYTAAIKWGVIETGIRTTGKEAATSAGEVDALAGSFRGLARVMAPLAVLFGLNFFGQKFGFKNAAQAAGNPLFGTLGPDVTPDVIDPLTGFPRGTPKDAEALRRLNRKRAPDRLFGGLQVGGIFASIGAAFAGVTGPAGTTRGRRPLSLQGRFNLAELKLAQAQLTKTLADDKRVLIVERAITEQQIDQAKTLKDKTKFTQQLVGINNQILSINQQQTDAIKQANQALKDRADAIKSAIIDRLQAAQQRRDDAQAVKDARENLRIYQRIGAPGGIAAARLALGQARTQQRVDVLSGLTPRLTRGGQFTLGNVITINVHGTDSPEKVANQVVTILKRRDRHTVTQRRGPAPGG